MSTISPVAPNFFQDLQFNGTLGIAEAAWNNAVQTVRQLSSGMDATDRFSIARNRGRISEVFTDTATYGINPYNYSSYVHSAPGVEVGLFRQVPKPNTKQEANGPLRSNSITFNVAGNDLIKEHGVEAFLNGVLIFAFGPNSAMNVETTIEENKFFYLTDQENLPDTDHVRIRLDGQNKITINTRFRTNSAYTRFRNDDIYYNQLQGPMIELAKAKLAEQSVPGSAPTLSLNEINASIKDTVVKSRGLKTYRTDHLMAQAARGSSLVLHVRSYTRFAA